MIRLQNASFGYQPVVMPIVSSASNSVLPFAVRMASLLDVWVSVACGIATCAVISSSPSASSMPRATMMAVFWTSMS